MAERPTTLILVKRHGSSRLYDTHAAQYVTLHDIAEMLRAEQSVVVYDATSGADITPSVLAKIIAGRR